MYPKFAPEPCDDYEKDYEAFIDHLDSEIYLELGRNITDNEEYVIKDLVGEGELDVNGFYDAGSIICAVCKSLGIDPDSINSFTDEEVDLTLRYVTKKYIEEKL